MDLILMHPDAFRILKENNALDKICTVEVKALGQKPTALQTKRMQELTNIGCVVRCVTDGNREIEYPELKQTKLGF